MILDSWKSRENLFQILHEPFLDLFFSTFDFCSNSMLLSVGFTAWQVYLQDGIWSNNLQESKKLVFYFYFSFL